MRFLSQHLASLDHPKDDSCAMKYTISRLLICSTDSVATIVHEIICSTILIETLAFGQLTQPITRLNRLKKGVNFEKRPGGAHRVHFEHSLLHESVTTIREYLIRQLFMRKKRKSHFFFTFTLSPLHSYCLDYE